MDEALEGTVRGWPVAVTLMRNPGEKWVGVHAVCYTDEDDNSAPDDIRSDVEDMCADYTTKRQAMTALRKAGFVED